MRRRLLFIAPVALLLAIAYGPSGHAAAEPPEYGPAKGTLIIVAGSAAGATIQGEYLVRGDTSGPNIEMTEEPNHQHGLSFLRRAAIDQHINTRLRWDDLIPVIKKYPNLLGIGLSEGTAIVVTGDTFEVMGKWKVAIHDNTRVYQPWEKPYYVLSLGDVYNMKTRKIEKLRTG